MKKKYQNIFWALGLVAIAVMLLTFDIDYRELWENIRNAGWWLVAIMVLWMIIYLLNNLSWLSLLDLRAANGAHAPKVGFWQMYKYTISGFALNDATPCGLMGGEPYRIMELTPLVGGVRATSSVVAYTMMHVLCHISFWLCSAIVFLIFYDVEGWITGFCIATIIICSCLVYLFMIGYRKGIADKLMRLLCKLPLLGKKITVFYERHADAFVRADKQIASLHGERRMAFIKSFAYEFASRCLTGVEIYLIMLSIHSDATLLDSIMIIAFTSLLSNLCFFMPMQLGAREGGFALAIAGLSMTSSVGAFVAIICRVRELLWIVIGVLLIKVRCRKPDATAPV